MEEVRAVLHAIFRCLLKRLDDRELRDRHGFRQGKTWPLIHISDFLESTTGQSVDFVIGVKELIWNTQDIHRQRRLTLRGKFLESFLDSNFSKIYDGM
ncbi:hypothetical protein [Rhizobium sullae]|uniref:hypothetical protein n=1 Tax=Rhizobium sullae TaxID=50338 RepID=UPI0012FE31CC|nr:hypothetical protein [Rhizobium sullae]